MPEPDIFLKDDRITVVGSGDNPKPGLEVATGEDRDPDIKLNPDWANIVAGGGGGDASEGDLVLLDEDSNPRIHLTAERGNKWDPEDENRVWINGEDGIMKLAANSTRWEEQDVKIDATTANIELGGGERDEDDDRGVSEGDVHLLDRDGNTRVQITAERGNRADDDDNRVWINGEKGLIKLASVNTRWENEDIKLDSTTATIEVGGGKREADANDESVGRLVLRDEAGNRQVDIMASEYGDNSQLELYTSPETEDEDPTRGVGLDGDMGNVDVGGIDTSGDLRLFRAKEGVSQGTIPRTMWFKGEEATAEIGGSDADGTVEVRNADNQETAAIRGGDGTLAAGGEKTEGSVVLSHNDGQDVEYRLDATQSGLVCSVRSGSSGGFTDALRIDPDGSVHVSGGSVDPL